MNDILKVIKIDYISIKPYFTLKNLFLFAFAAFLPLFFSKNVLSFTFVAFFIVMLYLPYPFLVSETSGLEKMYRMFAISNKNFVRGRYGFGLLNGFLGISLAFIITSIISLFIKEKDLLIKEIGFITSAFYLVYIMLLSLQYPLMFKLDYKKARQLSVIPIFVLVFLGSYIVNLIDKDKLLGIFKLAYQNKLLTIIILIVIIIGILVFSIKVSEKFYEKKDI